jgi:phage-related baseplate assembly protein
MLREDIRMLTDTVEVVGAEMIDVNVKAKIILMASAPAEILQTIKKSFIEKFAKMVGLGVSVSRSWIISNLFLDGVKDVELITPANDILVASTDCACLSLVELFT